VAPVDDSPALPDLATIEVPAATSQQP
jgi:hypothetical protein